MISILRHEVKKRDGSLVYYGQDIIYWHQQRIGYIHFSPGAPAVMIVRRDQMSESEMAELKFVLAERDRQRVGRGTAQDWIARSFRWLPPLTAEEKERQREAKRKRQEKKRRKRLIILP